MEKLPSSDRLPTLGVIVCTYQRRELVINCIRALDAQADQIDQLLVVVDGSKDGSADALRALKLASKLTIVEHANMGAAASRNVGAKLVESDILYFLDDDMEVIDGSLLARRESHANGAQVLLGAVPLHPKSPNTILSENVGRWAEEMIEKYAEGQEMPWGEVFMGNTSINRKLFSECQGMRTEFNSMGKWGNSDTELAFRLDRKGAKISFSRKAAAMQLFVVPPWRHINRYRDLGRADVHLVRLHPHLKEQRTSPFSGYSTIPVRLKPMVKRYPATVDYLLRPGFYLLSMIIKRGSKKPYLNSLAWVYCEIFYWRGVQEASQDESLFD